MPPAAKKKAAGARIPLANLEELAAIWSNDARLPTVESRKAWCAARNLDYGHVNRQFWWKKSAKLKANKENVKGPRGGCYALPVGTPPVIAIKQEEEEEKEEEDLQEPVKIELPSSPSIPSSDTLCPSSPPFVLKKSPSQEPIALEEIPMPPTRKRVRKKGPARKRLGKKPVTDALVIKEESIAVQEVLCGLIVEEKPAVDLEKPVPAPAPAKRKPVVTNSEAPARKRVRFDSPCTPLSLEDLSSTPYCDGSCDLCSLPLPNPNESMTLDTDTTRLEALYPWYFQPTYQPVFKTMPSDIPKALWSLSAIAYESIT
ncbi:hypothetical protein CPB85DRAFT_1437760 [Mucidula mucida]|nr:hypothetical protein CPB85DRAFT_1437760 [Mucidula mucida]